ncbi:hypothetical protein MNEG_16079, partial [Monoraphidium neglectum]
MWRSIARLGGHGTLLAHKSFVARQITSSPAVLASLRPTKRGVEVQAALKRRVKKTEFAGDDTGVGVTKDQAQKRKVLNDVVANINMKHGDGSLMSLGDKPLAV